MQKIICLVLCCCILFCGVLTSCADSSPEETTSEPSETTPEPSETSLEDLTYFTESPSIETNTVILDDENFAFSILRCGMNDNGFFFMDVVCENKTEDPVVFTFKYFSAEMLSVDLWWEASVEPLGTLPSTIEVSSPYMPVNPSEIEFCLEIYHAETFEDIYSWDFTFQPDESVPPNHFEYSPASTDIQILENDLLSLYYTGSGTYDQKDLQLNFVFINKSDHELMITINNTTLNDIPVAFYWGYPSAPQRTSYLSLLWTRDILDEHQLTPDEIHEISFSFIAYDSSPYEAYDPVIEELTIMIE